MLNKLRSKDDILKDIQALVETPGYIYTLLMIIFEDFHVDLKNLHKVDSWAKLNMNEAAMLVGLLIQKPIDFTQPQSVQNFIEAKKRTRELMQELHQAFMNPFFEKLKKIIHENNEQPSKESIQNFFNQGNLLTEPIFYSGTGVYDFQYLDFLSKKYQYDSNWLKTNRGFVFNEVIEIFKKIKEIVHKKSDQVNLYVSLNPNKEEIKEKARKKYKGDNFEKDFQFVTDLAEMHQYASLFIDSSMLELKPGSEEFIRTGQKAFCRNLVDLFTVTKTQVRELRGGDQFIKNFSIKSGDPECSRFKGIGAYNIANSHPLIELDDERLLLPIPFLLSEAIYEAPFYWMISDAAYKDTASTNRGNAGEDIVFQFLSKVFGDKAYRRILVKTTNSKMNTDIDVLCILGSKALCVQVKSKKLTKLSRKGDFHSLQKDFQGAVQDAYEQAWIAREKILDRTSKFFDEHGNEIKLSEEIDDVYMLVVTSENYPSLAHQTHTLLKLKENSPSPLAFTAFDLEIVTHYLNDPYDLLYYIRQRINLINHFRGDEEMVYLGYHLKNKLWKDNAGSVSLNYDFAQAIDRNYYPFRAAILVSDEGDSIKAQWKDDHFDYLCNQIKKIGNDKITDIIFHLYDLSGSARNSLVKLIKSIKMKTCEDNQFHSFFMPPDDKYQTRFCITYLSSETDSLEEVKTHLLVLGNLRKYKSKADYWLGLGSLKKSRAPFDLILYNYTPWTQDAELEKQCKHLPELVRTSYIDLKSDEPQKKKIGRNDPCPCGSSKKYKKCCLV
ncbi:MAG TPA: SEC-C metal-binding domain-containing protein [Oligoflexia bacterium]|nr:SEC-C metal-binding domain-containing protein [Oligoflexia bacterium]